MSFYTKVCVFHNKRYSWDSRIYTYLWVHIKSKIQYTWNWYIKLNFPKLSFSALSSDKKVIWLKRYFLRCIKFVSLELTKFIRTFKTIYVCKFLCYSVLPDDIYFWHNLFAHRELLGLVPLKSVLLYTNKIPGMLM